MQRNGADYYYHSDDNGNIMVVTDGNGIAERYRYGDFGSPEVFDGRGQAIPESAIGNPCMFKGLRYDRETDLYCGPSPHPIYGASYVHHCKSLRYLDPVAGRYLQRSAPDTFGNAYTAFGNNPWSSSPAPVARMKGDFTRGFVGDVLNDIFVPEPIPADFSRSGAVVSRITNLPVAGDVFYIQAQNGGFHRNSTSMLTDMPVSGELFGMVPNGGPNNGTILAITDMPVAGEVFAIASYPIGDDVYMLTEMPVSGESFGMVPNGGPNNGTVLGITDMPVAGEVFAIASYPIGDDIYLDDATPNTKSNGSASFLTDIVRYRSLGQVRRLAGAAAKPSNVLMTDNPVFGGSFGAVQNVGSQKRSGLWVSERATSRIHTSCLCFTNCAGIWCLLCPCPTYNQSVFRGHLSNVVPSEGGTQSADDWASYDPDWKSSIWH